MVTDFKRDVVIAMVGSDELEVVYKTRGFMRLRSVVVRDYIDSSYQALRLYEMERSTVVSGSRDYNDRIFRLEQLSGAGRIYVASLGSRQLLSGSRGTYRLPALDFILATTSGATGCRFQKQPILSFPVLIQVAAPPSRWPSIFNAIGDPEIILGDRFSDYIGGKVRHGERRRPSGKCLRAHLENCSSHEH